MAARKTSKRSKSSKSSPRGKSSTRGRKPSSSKSSRRSPSRRTKAASQPAEPRLSLDRKLDILGVGLALVGFLTLLSLLSTSRSVVTGAWVSLLRQSLGWGLYLLPLALVALGLWLILRHFERIPAVALERVLGLALLFLNLLVGLHFALFPPDRAASFAQAAAGRGGGYVGAAILEVSLLALGWWGTAIVLLAGLLIALPLALDLSIAELFGWVPPLVLRFQDWWDER